MVNRRVTTDACPVIVAGVTIIGAVQTGLTHHISIGPGQTVRVTCTICSEKVAGWASCALGGGNTGGAVQRTCLAEIGCKIGEEEIQTGGVAQIIVSEEVAVITVGADGGGSTVEATDWALLAEIAGIQDVSWRLALQTIS